MAKEYIEREAALNNLAKSYFAGVLDDLIHAEDAVTAVPAANVRENVKGEWNKRDSWFWYCSACGEPLRVMTDGIDNFDKEPNYCPNCGAKMMGGAEDG